jgi:hypothetical protein
VRLLRPDGTGFHAQLAGTVGAGSPGQSRQTVTDVDRATRVGADAAAEALGADHGLFTPAAFDDVVARLRDAVGGSLRIKEIN